VASTIAYTGAFLVAAGYAHRILGTSAADLVLPRPADVSGVISELRAQRRYGSRD
jgi:hypothetical protein